MPQPELVESFEEKVAAADQMIESFYPGRKHELQDHRDNEIKAIKILRLKIEVVAAKERYDMSVMQALDAASKYSEGGFEKGL